MKYRILKTNSSTHRKVEKLFEYAEELGLTIEFYGHRTILKDQESGKSYDLVDIDGGEPEPIQVFPSGVEFRLAIDL